MELPKVIYLKINSCIRIFWNAIFKCVYNALSNQYMPICIYLNDEIWMKPVSKLVLYYGVI